MEVDIVYTVQGSVLVVVPDEICQLGEECIQEWCENYLFDAPHEELEDGLYIPDGLQMRDWEAVSS